MSYDDLKQRLRDGEYVDGYETASAIEQLEAAVADLRRKNLELERVYEERGRQIERLESRPTGLAEGDFAVNAKDLHEVLGAFYGSHHHIMELWVIRNLPGSTISRLADQYNAQVRARKEES